MTDPREIIQVPQVGPASDEYRAVCAHSHGPDYPQCERPASLHIKVEDGRYGVVALASCDVHLGIARNAARVLADHPYEGFCGLPGTLWHPENRCVLDDSAPVRERVDALEGK